MVNSRNNLKVNLEADLHNKIVVAQEMLGDLRGAVQNVEMNSLRAKGEVQDAVNSIHQLLASRKQEVNRQIDLLCQSQINSLQESIRATYISLGSLQSTLSNIDSFDHTQLLNLHIPDLSWMKNCSTPSALEVQVDRSALEKDIMLWGTVNAKGLKGLIDVGTSASMPPRFVDYCDGKNFQDGMSHKSVYAGPSSVVSMSRQPKLPQSSQSSGNHNTSISLLPADPKDAKLGYRGSHFDQWLSDIHTQVCPETEEFELISVDDDFEKCDDKENAPQASFKEIAKNLEPTDTDSAVGAETVRTRSSSIVCIVNEPQDKDSNDLTKWLKPKKVLESKNIELLNLKVSETIVDQPTVGRREGKHDPMNNQFVDFPCLRLDHQNWIPKKKIRNSSMDSGIKSNSGNKFSDKEAMPPTYSLPTPFWLKKYH